MKLEETFVNLLIEHSHKVSTAESLTGGLISSLITSVPNSSRIFEMGFVTYSDDSKRSMLDVRRDTLKKHGAVSEQTAFEMAAGAFRISGADVALSVTGYAGPGGGDAKNPVGSVYIGCATKDGIDVKHLLLSGSREEIRNKVAYSAFEMAAGKLGYDL